MYISTFHTWHFPTDAHKGPLHPLPPPVPSPGSVPPFLFAIWYPSKAVRPLTHVRAPNPWNLTRALFCFFLIRSHEEPWFSTSGPSNRVTAWLCQLCFLSDSILIIRKSQKNWERSRASAAALRWWRLRTKQRPQISFAWGLVCTQQTDRSLSYYYISNVWVSCQVTGLTHKAPRFAVRYSRREGATAAANPVWLQEPVPGWDATFPGKCKEMETAPPSSNQRVHLVHCW